MKKINLFVIPFILLGLNACSQSAPQVDKTVDTKTYPQAKPASYWKQVLTPEAYEILVNKGTEQPYHNPYWNNHEKGMYVSAATGKPLFSSDAKFESGTGWPSFWQPIAEQNIATLEDASFGMRRVAVICRRCDAHLGHVFEDGPRPSGLRYCMNSAALKLDKAE